MVQQRQHRSPITVPNGPPVNPLTVHGVAAGNLLLFSAIRASDTSAIYFTGDPVEQARRCFRNLDASLRAAGATLDHVARVIVYLDDFKWRPAFDQVWAETFPTNPPARVMLKAGSANDDPMGNAQFVLDVIAVRPGESLREPIELPKGAPPLDPNTVAGVKAGGFIFLSSVRGGESSNVYLPSDPKQQVLRAFENLKSYLAAAGGGYDNLARVVVHFHDLKYRGAFNDHWSGLFDGTNNPARIAFTAGNANEHPEGNAHFTLDVIGVAPGGELRRPFYIAEGGAPHGPGSVAGSIANGMIFCGAMRGGTENVFFMSSPRIQAERAFINMERTMRGAGASLDNIARVTAHFERLEFRAAFEEQWKETFPSNPPALIEMKAGSANHTRLSNAYFVLDVIASAP